jgi:DNA-binding beta-propeller fold protein YncE
VASAAPLPEPDVVIPWGDGALEPGLVPRGGEQMAVGPVAFAVAPFGIVVSDDAHERLLVIAQGRVTGSVPLGTGVADLRVGAGGTIFALTAALDRVLIVPPAGAVRSARIPAVIERPRGLAVGPDGRAYVVDSNGISAPVQGAVEAGRATPLGAESSLHAGARLTGRTTGEMYVWSWDRPATLQPDGPDRTIQIRTERRLGLVRPLTALGDGSVFVLAETLSDGSPLEVRAEVLRIDATGATTGRLVLPLATEAPANRYVDVEPDGTLWLLRSDSRGLTLTRWARDAWGVEVTR